VMWVAPALRHHQIAIFSTSSSEISSLRQSYSLVVRGEAWLAIVCACSSLSLFLRYAVMPVARKVCAPIFVVIPAAAARRVRVKARIHD